VNFANTGNPNGKGMPEWPAYSAQSDDAMELGDHVAVRTETNKAGLDFFDQYYQAQRSAGSTSHVAGGGN